MNVMNGTSANVFVQMFNIAASLGKLPLIVFDVDLTLQDSTCRITTPEQREIIRFLNFYTHGGVVMMSGRKISAIDETFGYSYAASGEHHSEIRPVAGGDKISLAPKGYASLIASKASELIQTRLTLVHEQRGIVSNLGKSVVIFTEEKDHAVALIHSLDHETIDGARRILFEEIAPKVIRDLKLSQLFEVTKGSDAIEIVPKGLDPDSKAHELLVPEQIKLLQTDGLHKGTGLHNFMSLPQNQDRIPFVVGDSKPDGLAMLEAQKYGGGGAWVLNGKDVTKEFADAVAGRTIENFNMTYGEIAASLPVAERLFANHNISKAQKDVMRAVAVEQRRVTGMHA